MPFASIGSVRLHYDEAGPPDGPVVLLLHGSLRSAADWTPYLPRLADAGFRALALDDRGHGASTRFGEPGNPWSALEIPRLVEDARDFLAAVAPARPAHVVGHSRGATVGAWLAFEDGVERVASLVVAASPPSASEVFRMRFEKAAARAAAGAAAGAGEGYDAELARRTFAYLSRIPDDHFPAEFMTQYRGPGLVVEGGHDPLYSPVQTMFWRAWLKNADVERVEAGHLFPFEGGEAQAWFEERLLRFLREVEARGA